MTKRDKINKLRKYILDEVDNKIRVIYFKKRYSIEIALNYAILDAYRTTILRMEWLRDDQVSNNFLDAIKDDVEELVFDITQQLENYK